MSLSSFIIDQIRSNDLAGAAVIGAPVAAFSYSIKELPKTLFRSAKRAISIDVRFNSDMPDYPAITRYITSEIVRDRFSRNYVYQAECKWDHYEQRELTQHHGLTAGFGKHFGIYRGSPVMVERHIDENDKTERFKEHLCITFFTRSRKIVQRFAHDVAIAAGKNLEEFTSVPVFINSGDYWSRTTKLPLRALDSVITKDDLGRQLVDAVREFEDKRDEHHRLGLPHHFGIMLVSQPGCGKSSLIHALASELKRSIYYLNLGSVEKDKQLTELMSGRHDWNRILLAIEDIDAAGVQVNRDKDEKTPVSLSAFLNTLDGILCPDGLVAIATTNHYDRLDPALTRPGRFDHTVHLGKLGKPEFERMARLFGQPMPALPANDIEMTGAEMRALLLKEAA